MMKATALINIDLQNDYCHPDGVFAQKAGFPVASIPSIYPRINELASICRRRAIPVIWVKMRWTSDEEVGLLARKSPFLKEEGLRQGTWGAELVEALDIQPKDLVVEKQRFSAFYDTKLEQELKKREIRTLIFTGVRTDFCVESTVRDAFFRDYENIVVRDAVAGYVDELHQHSLQLMNTVFSDVKEAKDIAVDLEKASSF